MQLAVCVLVRDSEGRVLSISRPHNPDDVGLIGGGVEPEDGDPVADRAGTLRRAAARELREEAGIQVDLEQLRPVFAAMGRTRWAVTFVVDGPVGAPVLGLNEEGIVSWASAAAVCAGSFGDYNRALFAALASGEDRA